MTDELINERLLSREQAKEEHLSRKYANFLFDFTFKRVFGNESNKDLVISFLNALFPNKKIKDVEYNATEKVGDTSESKKFILDLLCTSEDKTQFIVEVQNYEQEDFFKRCLAYGARLYSESAYAGNSYGQFLPVYVVALMSDAVTKSGKMHRPKYRDKLIYHYLFAEKDTHEVPFEGISCIFVELEKFNKTEAECVTLLDKWFYLIKNSNFLEDRPGSFREKVFDKLFELLEMSKFTPMENRAYIHEWIAEYDRISILRTAENRGIEKGREEGLELGKEQEQLRIAKKMKDEAVDIQTISKCTGLTVEQIESL